MVESLHDLLWAAVEPSLYDVTREQYIAGLEGWDITPHQVGDEVVGIVLTQGPELHFVTFGKRWGLRRADVRRYLDPILAEHGVVKTRTAVDDLRQQRFNKILGFTQTGADEFFIDFELREPLFRGNT